MKIAFLSSRSNHTIKWINALAKEGHEVHWITQDTKHEKNDKADKRIIIHQLPFKSNFGYYLNVSFLRRLLQKIKPDILNVHNASGYGTLARLTNWHPYLLNAWGSDVFDMKNASYQRMVVKNLKAADGLASTSYGMANRMRSLLQDDSKEIGITPFGVDLERFDYHLNEQYENKDSFVIGVIKTIAPKYGIKMLIDAFHIVKNQVGNKIKITFKIYGDGIQKKELENYVQSLGLDNCILFLGRIPNDQVPHALSEMDIFCLGSELQSESFGVAAVEAMAMKKPVIATDVTGFREVIVDGESGLLVEKGDKEAMALQIIGLLKDSELRASLGINARKRVEKFYDLDRNVEIMIKLYDSIKL